MTTTPQRKTTQGTGCFRPERAERLSSQEMDARVLAALRERHGASLGELVEEGVLPEDEAQRVRVRLLNRGAIRSVGSRPVAPPHDCPSCRCGGSKKGGRPRAIYMPVGDAEEPFSSPEGGSP